MFTYSAYNLHLRSELLLPELMPTAAAADVTVKDDELAFAIKEGKAQEKGRSVA